LKKVGLGGGEYAPSRPLNADIGEPEPRPDDAKDAIESRRCDGLSSTVGSVTGELEGVDFHLSGVVEGELLAVQATARARQLVLTLAKAAAVSDCFNRSAYPHILGDASTGLVGGLTLAELTPDDREGLAIAADEGVAGVAGDGGVSMALWFVIPRQTVLARREVMPLSAGM
jgi:hypothetical protein